MKTLRAGKRLIGPNHPCFIIAEAGVNHNGDLRIARKLIEAAASAKADAIKFQSFRAEDVASEEAAKAPYQLKTTRKSESQLAMLRRLELSPEAHRELQRYCAVHDILFISTPFDMVSADLLHSLKVPLMKIPSGEITNWPLISHIARKGLPILLSTGMSYLSEVKEALDLIRQSRDNPVVVLHCVSNYPAEPSDVHLRAMVAMRTALNLPVGYSDHTTGIEVALAAVALGACVIEKHFTLDKGLPGPDHRASIEPDELRALVEGVRKVEKALGRPVKRPAAAELANRALVRRSLAAAQIIPKGVVVKADMLKALRPANGISPRFITRVTGHRAKKTVPINTILSWSDLQ